MLFGPSTGDGLGHSEPLHNFPREIDKLLIDCPPVQISHPKKHYKADYKIDGEAEVPTEPHACRKRHEDYLSYPLVYQQVQKVERKADLAQVEEHVPGQKPLAPFGVLQQHQREDGTEGGPVHLGRVEPAWRPGRQHLVGLRIQRAVLRPAQRDHIEDSEDAHEAEDDEPRRGLDLAADPLKVLGEGREAQLGQEHARQETRHVPPVIVHAPQAAAEEEGLARERRQPARRHARQEDDHRAPVLGAHRPAVLITAREVDVEEEGIHNRDRRADEASGVLQEGRAAVVPAAGLKEWIEPCHDGGEQREHIHGPEEACAAADDGGAGGGEEVFKLARMDLAQRRVRENEA